MDAGAQILTAKPRVLRVTARASEARQSAVTLLRIFDHARAGRRDYALA